MSKPTISLVIPAYNEEYGIGACLEHAIKNSNGRFFEIIVVDNASTDRTAHIARLCGATVVYESRKGITSARQRGLDEARGEWIAFIDADTRLPRGWVEKADQLLARHPNAASISGPYRYYDGTRLQRAIMGALWHLSVPPAYWLFGYALLGGNFIARRAALTAIGGFDRSIAFFGEDTDTARRLHAQGKALFKMNFYIYTSIRRLAEEGIIKTNYRYALNYLSEAILHRPFTRQYRDIRLERRKSAARPPAKP